MPAALVDGSSQGSPEDENLWSRILTEVQSRSSSALPQAGILVLGDNDSGKTSLIARLQHNDDPKKGSGLEYHYIEVNPDYRDGTYAYQLGSALPDVGPGESARLGVWVLDGDPIYAPLMRFALSAETLENSVVILTASMATPWSIMDSLQRWSRILQDQLETASCYDKKVLRESREKQVRFWQEYVEPLDSSSHSDAGAKVPSMEMDHVLLPLGESTLTHNTGLAIVVVITKCDSMASLEKEYDFKEEHFDFIQQHIRKFCLSFGAALVFTSVKESRNCDTLYKYLLHRVYGFPFTRPAMVVEKDSIFIPAGWDNEKKISILYENLSSVKPDDFYADHIKKPVLRRPVPKDAEFQAEDDQTFLTKQQTVFAQTPSPQPTKPQNQESPRPKTTGPSPVSPVPVSQKKTDGVKIPTQMSVPGGGQNSEGVLAAFFNNLLKTKPGANGPPGTPGSPLNSSRSFDAKTPLNADAEAELARMLTESNHHSPEEAKQIAALAAAKEASGQ